MTSNSVQTRPRTVVTETVLFWTVALLLQLIAFSLIRTPGSSDVEGYWMQWMDNMVRHGPVEGYVASNSDYPPLSFMILGAVAGAAKAFGIPRLVALKLSLWLFLVLTSTVFYLATRKPWLSLGVNAAYLLSSMGLGYLDVYFVPSLVLAFWAIRAERFSAGLVLLVVSGLIKFQPLILVPAVVLYYWHRKQLRPAVLAPAALLAFGCILVFGRAIFLAFENAAVHFYLSGLAMNYHWLLTQLANILTFGTPATNVVVVELPRATMWALKAGFGVLYVWSLLTFRPRSFVQCLQGAAMLGILYFTFCPAVHENHLLFVLVPLALIAADAGRFGAFVFFSVFASLNLLFIFGVTGRGRPFPVPYLDIALALALVARVGQLIVDYRKDFRRAVSRSADSHWLLSDPQE